MSRRSPLSTNSASGNGITNIAHIRDDALAVSSSITTKNLIVTESIVYTGTAAPDIKNIDVDEFSSSDVSLTVGTYTSINTPVDIDPVSSVSGSGAWDTSSVAIETNPTNGVITNFIPATGVATYTPNPGYSGQDIYTYSITDDLDVSRTVIQYIGINP